jgi:tetratricopeptide (TPR) repeat protein
MSPEQATGREMDARSDQFSFGVMLYEMLTRVRPFERETRTETLAAILRDDPAPMSEVNDGISRDLERIVSRCLAKHPRERYASTRDLARDLREVRDSFTQSTIERRSVRTPALLRRNPLYAILAVVLLLTFAGGYVMWQRRDSARRITSLAVAPFRDLGGTPEGHVFADGISEMVATRLAQVRELRIATPFDGAPIQESDDVRAIAKRTGAHAVVRGTVQRGGGDVRVTVSLVDAHSGRTVAASTATRPATDLFALQDAVADDLLRALGRPAPPRAEAAQAELGAEDQRRFTEAVGLLQRVRDEQSVDRAIALLEATLRNARESGAVNSLLGRGLLYKSSLARRPALVEQAMVYATRGVALAGNDAETHITLGQLQSASGRHADAVSSFQRALSLHPENPDAFLGLAGAYAGLGRGADAEALYRKVLAVRSDGTGAMMRYGGFCYSQGRFEDAVVQFRRVAELLPDYSHAHANLGGALVRLGRHEEALTAFQRSIAIHPTAIGLGNLGALQFSLGRYDDARKNFERATQLAPSDMVAWANLGDALRWTPGMRERSGEAYARAIAAARDALEVKPNDAYTRSIIAVCLAKSGRADEGQTEIRRALERDPTNALVLYKAAVIALIRGNHDSAISWLERAVASGYPPAELERDPELQALRALPSFRKAVQSRT